MATEIYFVDLSIFPNVSSYADLTDHLIPYSKSGLPKRDAWFNELIYTTDVFDNYSIRSPGKDGITGIGITPETPNEFHLDIVYSNGRFSHAPF